MKHICLKKTKKGIKISLNPSFSKGGNERESFLKKEEQLSPL